LTTYVKKYTHVSYKNGINVYQGGILKSPFITPEQLAARWNTTPATLSQWRWNGRGPIYTKIGRAILYHMQDIREFESQKARRDTTCSGYGTLSRDNRQEERRFYVKDDQLVSA
jgi:hypothetical protein